MYVDCGMGLLRFSIKAIHTHTQAHPVTHTQARILLLYTHIYIATFMKFAWQNVGQFVKLGSETHTDRQPPLLPFR